MAESHSLNTVKEDRGSINVGKHFFNTANVYEINRTIPQNIKTFEVSDRLRINYLLQVLRKRDAFLRLNFHCRLFSASWRHCLLCKTAP